MHALQRIRTRILKYFLSSGVVRDHRNPPLCGRGQVAIIRSVAWEWKRVGVNAEVDLGDEGAVERGAVARMEVMRIVALFDDDRVAQKIVLAMMQGARGEELEQASGLSKIEYESKRKKIRRRIEKSNL